MQQELAFDAVSACGLVDDIRYCANIAEFVALIAVAVVVALALHPRVLGSALKLIGEPAGAVKRLGVPPSRLRFYLFGLALLTLLALLWSLAGLYHGPGREALWDFTHPAGFAVAALLFGATFGGLALLIALAQHTLERRLGAGYGSLLLGASAIGAALSIALMDSLHVLSLIAGAIVGAAVISLYRAVDGLPWYAAAAGCIVGALLVAVRTHL